MGVNQPLRHLDSVSWVLRCLVGWLPVLGRGRGKPGPRRPLYCIIRCRPDCIRASSSFDVTLLWQVRGPSAGTLLKSYPSAEGGKLDPKGEGCVLSKVLSASMEFNGLPSQPRTFMGLNTSFGQRASLVTVTKQYGPASAQAARQSPAPRVRSRAGSRTGYGKRKHQRVSSDLQVLTAASTNLQSYTHTYVTVYTHKSYKGSKDHPAVGNSEFGNRGRY